ncbi:MBL fold metallo-hydrolase [Streptomyces sp. NPDC004658]|uniref:MBL fold metallo-hydrolase n=1 Tax=Streptomyces sp. NPDC004658 TaxID=3154672 RepID=UPI0033A92185
MSTGSGWFLAPWAVAQPLIHRWYAWPHLLSPHTAALNLRDRQLQVMHSYVKAPHLHERALRDPAMFGGPFLDPGTATVADIEALVERTTSAAAPLLRLAEDIDDARRLLREKADGNPLSALYPLLGDTLRGRVELAYDTSHRPQIRFFEPLLYASAALYDRSAQTISLRAGPDPAQPFIFNSPVMPDARRVDLPVPFDAPELDTLFGAEPSGVDPEELARDLGVAPDRRALFRTLFTDTPPAPPSPVAEGVRMRFFGHACVLLESAAGSVLMDPLIGYAGDGHDHFTFEDLPARLDAIVLSHAHPDHVGIETLLRLRHRTDTVIVPRDSGGSLADPGLGVLLENLGFRTVRRVQELESVGIAEGITVTALPFLGEHADLDIWSKSVFLVRMDGRSLLFATDTTLLEPALYDLLSDLLPPVDALFIGLESVGAPASWLYGPLLETRLPREVDQRRRINGSDAVMAAEIARRVGARRVFVYAMGLEPWLRHITGSSYDPDSEQLRQTRMLLETCAERQVPAELLHMRKETFFPPSTPSARH